MYQKTNVKLKINLLTFNVSCFRGNPRGIAVSKPIVLQIMLPGKYHQRNVNSGSSEKANLPKTTFSVVPTLVPFEHAYLPKALGYQKTNNPNHPPRIRVRKELSIKPTVKKIIIVNSTIQKNQNENRPLANDPNSEKPTTGEKNNPQMDDIAMPSENKNELICKVCLKRFAWKSTLKTHFIRVHTDNYEFSCEECGKQFKIWGELRSHMRTRHRKANEIDPQEGIPSRNKKRVRYKKIDPLSVNSELFCKNCNTKFDSVADLKTHIDNVHVKIQVSQNKQMYSCQFCGYSYEKKNHLSNHLNHRHNIAIPREPKRIKINPKVSKEIVDSNEVENSEKANETENSNTKKSNETENLRERQNLESKDDKSKSEKKGTKSDETGEFRCEICGKGFTKKRYCAQHVYRIHSSREMLKCDECGDGFKKKVSLIKHIRIHEKTMLKAKKKIPRNDKYTCHICGVKVNRKETLKIHHIRKHSSQFNYPCQQCDKVFKIKGDLTTHTRLNHKEPKAICEVCGKVTKNKHSLYVHQKYVHFQTEFICPICKKCMVSQENLDQHVNIYHAKKQRVYCDYCKNSFMNRSSLKNHIAIVHNEKTFSCETCGKSFGRSYRLKHHLLTHTNIRPYICRLCGKQFKQKLSLTSHIKSHPDEHPPIPNINVDDLLKRAKK